MFRPVFASVIALILVWGSASAQAAGDLDELLRVIPEDANVLMVVRVQDILKSPRAAKEDWAKKQEEAYLAGAEAIPPWLSVIVRATHLHLEDSSIGWSVGVARTMGPANMQRIAEHNSGIVEKIGKSQVVKTQEKGFFTQLGPKMIGVIAPAYRQQAAKWLKFASSNTESKLPAYLAEAAQNPAPIVIAIDTQDMIDPDSLRNWLKSTKSLEGKPGKVDGVSYIYNNLKGITVAVTFGEQTTMQLTLNLGVPVGINSLEVKRTLIEYLEDSGAAFSDLNNAELTAKDKVVTLTAPLTDAGLRRIFSLIITPNPGGSHSMSETPPVPQADVDAKKSKTASQRYFTQVDQMIDDLSNKTARANNYDRTAVWHDSYAKKIDSLSLKDVDPALADYGRNISQKLRAIGASLRGVSLKLSTAQKSLVVDYSVNPGQVGGWNSGGWLDGAAMYSPPTWRATSNLEDVRKRQADAVEKGADQREQIWQSIESDRQDIRKKMLETFGEDFTQGK